MTTCEKCRYYHEYWCKRHFFSIQPNEEACSYFIGFNNEEYIPHQEELLDAKDPEGEITIEMEDEI